MRNFLIALAAGIGVAGITTVFVLIFLGALRLVDRSRPRDEYPITGDPTFTRMTGDYQTGVDLRLPEPADHVPDDGGPVPKLDENWPGLRKPKRRAF